MQTILDAIAVGNYELFLAVGDSDYKATMNRDKVSGILIT
ncbi:hypothetical protein COO91_09853 (plasmid) [Nostoc flagelliforme CCNUN1]|uniref:Uncharacterized protein n=1 Tax=Nostoc flagelliforme CCNUN1 TaxID=2038116 RepID=A0A2K8T7Q0_9NOSO|nr:hypothetical protein COO91_09853 [Nostoc flagelliforme CCNUN1]